MRNQQHEDTGKKHDLSQYPTITVAQIAYTGFELGGDNHDKQCLYDQAQQDRDAPQNQSVEIKNIMRCGRIHA
jgi:hypothetical protein